MFNDKILSEIFGKQESKEPPENERKIVEAVNAQLTSHKWEWCGMCGWHVQCACGNNCCNGGSGETAYGNGCNCDDAYALQDKGIPGIH